MRTLNTSIVAILPIVSLLVVGSLILGATTLQEFGLALLIGLLSGAYSSIFIASPILALLKEREPRYATIRQRLATRGPGGPPLTPAAAAASLGTGGDRPAPAAVEPGGPAGPAPVRSTAPRPGAKRPPPRPRKKKRRR
jgi:preprotein translocase subunit SecF